ncbi:aerotolerance regulator BatA [Putridiphycobacter roseus]|uniref:Aerotolerance regulator BatA n=1 Tax=Putridiphycobacter roseus TaxID=2219161 RepID=A0A2W1NM92_9FLAO|nr:VWA domain-containing protein [Putridiphycobacter roseus]PZE16762.1 aerotolerance regulator BatA [Putridiphycobacter roseus]
MFSKLTEISPLAYSYVYKDFLWLLLLIPILLLWYVLIHIKKARSINHSSVAHFENPAFNFWLWFKHFNFLLFLISFAFFVVAFSRPQDPKDVEEYKKKNIEGIDVVLTIDVSSSMFAEDFKPNRLESAKKTAMQFIKQRPNDRIGVVAYEGEAYTQAPLTTDHQLLLSLLSEIESGTVDQGTAIGSGLITAVNRLYKSDTKSKVIILLTDGENNRGDIDPLTAAQVASEYGIRVYTIGVGRNGMAPYPVQNMFGTTSMQNIEVRIDEDLLKEIATITDGQYFRAENENELNEIYGIIDKLEKSKVKVLEFKTNPPEKYYGFLFYGILLLTLYFLIDKTLLKRII